MWFSEEDREGCPRQVTPVHSSAVSFPWIPPLSCVTTSLPTWLSLPLPPHKVWSHRCPINCSHIPKCLEKPVRYHDWGCKTSPKPEGEPETHVPSKVQPIVAGYKWGLSFHYLKQSCLRQEDRDFQNSVGYRETPYVQKIKSKAGIYMLHNTFILSMKIHIKSKYMKSSNWKKFGWNI